MEAGFAGGRAAPAVLAFYVSARAEPATILPGVANGLGGVHSAFWPGRVGEDCPGKSASGTGCFHPSGGDVALHFGFYTRHPAADQQRACRRATAALVRTAGRGCGNRARGMGLCLPFCGRINQSAYAPGSRNRGGAHLQRVSFFTGCPAEKLARVLPALPFAGVLRRANASGAVSTVVVRHFRGLRPVGPDSPNAALTLHGRCAAAKR